MERATRTGGAPVFPLTVVLNLDGSFQAVMDAEGRDAGDCVRIAAVDIASASAGDSFRASGVQIQSHHHHDYGQQTTPEPDTDSFDHASLAACLGPHERLLGSSSGSSSNGRRGGRDSSSENDDYLMDDYDMLASSSSPMLRTRFERAATPQKRLWPGAVQWAGDFNRTPDGRLLHGPAGPSARATVERQGATLYVPTIPPRFLADHFHAWFPAARYYVVDSDERAVLPHAQLGEIPSTPLAWCQHKVGPLITASLNRLRSDAAHVPIRHMGYEIVPDFISGRFLWCRRTPQNVIAGQRRR